MTAFLPLLAIPFVLLTWMILNIVASISPCEVSLAFYGGLRFVIQRGVHCAYRYLVSWKCSLDVSLITDSVLVVDCWLAHREVWAFLQVSQSMDPEPENRRTREDVSSRFRFPRLRVRRRPQSIASDVESTAARVNGCSRPRLLETAALYRDFFGPSVSIPIHVKRLLGLIDETDLPNKASDKQNRFDDERDQLNQDCGSNSGEVGH